MHARRIVAFARRSPAGGVIAVAPRFLAELCERPGILPLGRQVWGDTCLPLPWLPAGARLRDIISGRPAVVETESQEARLLAGDLLTAFPVALLEYTLEPNSGN